MTVLELGEMTVLELGEMTALLTPDNRIIGGSQPVNTSIIVTLSRALHMNKVCIRS